VPSSSPQHRFAHPTRIIPNPDNRPPQLRPCLPPELCARLLSTPSALRQSSSLESGAFLVCLLFVEMTFVGGCADKLLAASVDHTPQPHPASPNNSLPSSFKSSHTSFSSYRDHAQQFGPLRKTITAANAGIGGQAGSNLGPVAPPNGVFFDRNELPSRFHRSPLSVDEIEAIETGGAAALA